MDKFSEFFESGEQYSVWIGEVEDALKEAEKKYEQIKRDRLPSDEMQRLRMLVDFYRSVGEAVAKLEKVLYMVHETGAGALIFLDEIDIRPEHIGKVMQLITELRNRRTFA